MAAPLAPVMLGIGGLTLSLAEREYIKTHQPFAFILFARSIENVAQVQALTAELAELSATPTPLIAIDQEGGRVQRLTFGGRLPPVQCYGQWFAAAPEVATEITELHGFLLASQLRAVGATWVLAPCLDLALPETHAIIGNRAFSGNPAVVATLGAAVLRGIKAGGCLACLKHAPGHGRTSADTHVQMPTVAAPTNVLEADAAPFKALAAQADFIMTAHIKYPAWDAHHAATFSATILTMMRAQWGFKGLILADDLGMHALSGPYAERATQALQAGCDAVIGALSIVKQGMAGTVWDKENFKVLAQATLPAMAPHASQFVQNLQLPPAPTAAENAQKLARFKALWATRPTAIEAMVTV
jgi:beta-N-acetylhexosaminidase